MGTWTYSQRSGAIRSPDGDTLECGYSGKEPCTNVPATEVIKDWGPIPTGSYRILDAVDHETCGPVSLPLEPNAMNSMYSRSNFLIHGDNADHTASTGCIILSRPTRDEISASECRDLLVTE